MQVTKQNSILKWQSLLPVENDHVAWFHDFLAYMFFPESRAAGKKYYKPTSFAFWFVEACNDPNAQAEIIEKLNAIHKDLMKYADAIEEDIQSIGGRPSLEKFENFMTHYEEFLANIRRLEHDMLAENSGYDPVTGLRNVKLLKADIERELDRLSRQGKNFTVAMARLDYFQEIIEHYSKDEALGYIKLVAELIKLSVRSYDDAYYLGEDKFLLVLKQSEIKGGISALERLRRELEGQDITFKFGNNMKPMSMSCCIAAPTESDNIDDLIQNLESDLDMNLEKVSDTVLEYYEMSPLQRYIKETESSDKY